MDVSIDGIIMALLVAALGLVSKLLWNALREIKDLNDRLIRLEEWRIALKEKNAHLYGHVRPDDEDNRGGNGDGFLD